MGIALANTCKVLAHDLTSNGHSKYNWFLLSLVYGEPFPPAILKITQELSASSQASILLLENFIHPMLFTDPAPIFQ